MDTGATNPSRAFTKLVCREPYIGVVPPIRVGDPSELLPPPMVRATPPDDDFAKIGRAVAAAKTRLDAIPPPEFEPLMRAVDLYAGLKRTLRTEYGMRISTNASLKMYEILGVMELIETGPEPVRAFCDAELPGAFICAINHYVRTLRPRTPPDWIASSYFPAAAAARGDPTILDDYYGLYAANRGRWLMGPPPNAMPEGAPPVSGDLTDAAVVEALAAAVHARLGGATLYTSDAGIGVSEDYNRQEELTALLNYGQVLCGILSLAPGGHLVTKQYTFVTPFSRGLIALLAALFDEVSVVKPVTSRPANSEVYIVGKGFRGVDPDLARALLARLAEYRIAANTSPADWSPLIDPELTAGVDSALLRAARHIHGGMQVNFLNEAADLYGAWRGRLDRLARSLAADASAVQKAWLAANPVRRIPAEHQLASADRGAGHRQQR